MKLSIWIFGIIVSLGGFFLMVRLFKPVSVIESIVIDRSQAEVFAYLTDFNHVEEMFDNLIEIELLSEQPTAVHSQYKRTLLIHGQQIPQIVTVEALVENEQFVTQTELYGFEVIYSYRLIEINESTAHLELSKKAEIQGVWNVLRPLLMHLLTRPEHDGGHLAKLKQAAEFR